MMKRSPIIVTFGVVSPSIGLLAAIVEMRLFAPTELVDKGYWQVLGAFLASAPMAIFPGVVLAYCYYWVFRFFYRAPLVMRWLGCVVSGMIEGCVFLLVPLFLGYNYSLLYWSAPLLGGFSAISCLMIYGQTSAKKLTK
jgi:hypothetical protein